MASLPRGLGLAAHTQSSGHPIADGRFAYAQGCLAEGDLKGAIELFEQTIEAAPDFAPAWLELGRARLAAGHPEAGDAFSRSLTLEPEDALGAGLHLERLHRDSRHRESLHRESLAHSADPGTAMTPAYVRRLFDHYAPRFEMHLRETLGYGGPERLFEAISTVCDQRGRPMRFETMLDLGCGTGLAGVRFSEVCDRMEGCDLAPAMLQQAAEKQLYQRLEALDALAFLNGDVTRASLILAADVFPYLGELGPVLKAAGARLQQDGLFAFSVQSQPDDGFSLGADFRYAHSAAYLRQAACEARLLPLSCEPIPVRREHGRDIPGLIVVLAHV